MARVALAALFIWKVICWFTQNLTYSPYKKKNGGQLGENLGDIETDQNDWEIELYVIQCADIPDGDTIEV